MNKEINELRIKDKKEKSDQIIVSFRIHLTKYITKKVIMNEF